MIPGRRFAALVTTAVAFFSLVAPVEAAAPPGPKIDGHVSLSSVQSLPTGSTVSVLQYCSRGSALAKTATQRVATRLDPTLDRHLRLASRELWPAGMVSRYRVVTAMPAATPTAIANGALCTRVKKRTKEEAQQAATDLRVWGRAPARIELANVTLAVVGEGTNVGSVFAVVLSAAGAGASRGSLAQGVRSAQRTVREDGINVSLATGQLQRVVRRGQFASLLNNYRYVARNPQASTSAPSLPAESLIAAAEAGAVEVGRLADQAEEAARRADVRTADGRSRSASARATQVLGLSSQVFNLQHKNRELVRRALRAQQLATAAAARGTRAAPRRSEDSAAGTVGGTVRTRGASLRVRIAPDPSSPEFGPSVNSGARLRAVCLTDDIRERDRTWYRLVHGGFVDARYLELDSDLRLRCGGGPAEDLAVVLAEAQTFGELDSAWVSLGGVRQRDPKWQREYAYGLARVSQLSAFRSAGIERNAWSTLKLTPIRQTAQNVYAYYESVWVKRPELQWAFMAKLAGAPVYGGLMDISCAASGLDVLPGRYLQM